MDNISTQTITIANQDRFNSAHYSEPLTAFTSGWQDSENLEAILDFIAPPVHVPRRFEFKQANNAQAFLCDADDIRSIGSQFKQVEYTGTSIYEKTLNKGLTIRIDHDEIADSNYQERYVHLLMQRLYRSEIKRALALLSSASNPLAVNFLEDGNHCDPDALIRKMLIQSSNSSGVRPNRLLFGENAWESRILSYSSQDNSASRRSLSFTLPQLSQSLLVDSIHILKARYQATPEHKETLLGKEIYAFFAQDHPSKDEPSNLKRFITLHDNNKFRVYKQETAKYTDLTVEHYSNIVLTSPLGLNKLVIQ